MTLLRLFSAILALTLPAQAGLVTRITEFEPHIKVTADELNDEFDNIISAINGNIDSSNIAEGAIATGNIATSAVTNVKLAPAVYATSSGVTASVIAGGAVGSPSSTSPALSTTAMTITGKRAVQVMLQSYSDGGSCQQSISPLGYITVGNFLGDTEAIVWGVLYRNSVRIMEVMAGGIIVDNNTDDKTFYAPLSAFNFIDTPTTGGSTSYEVKFYANDPNATMNATCVKAFAIEL